MNPELSEKVLDLNRRTLDVRERMLALATPESREAYLKIANMPYEDWQRFFGKGETALIAGFNCYQDHKYQRWREAMATIDRRSPEMRALRLLSIQLRCEDRALVDELLSQARSV